MTLKKTRFAPSPNGKLHLGHAYSAIISEKLAKKYDGEFIVRIEDIDIGRSSKENEGLILNDLKWLNIKFDPAIIKKCDERRSLFSQTEEQMHIGNHSTIFQTNNFMGERRLIVLKEI